MSNFHALKIQKIERITDKSVALTFEVPEPLKDAFRFKAGQYITLKTTIDGNEIRRDYSLPRSLWLAYHRKKKWMPGTAWTMTMFSL